jgi:hypothetical protein
VNNRAGPKDKDHAQTSGDIKKRVQMSQGQNSTRVIRQEKQGNTLNDADESELDVDDNGIELAAARLQRIHDATGNRLAIRMSRLRGLVGAGNQFTRLSFDFEMEARGFEPLTFSLRTRRSTN